MPDIADLPSTDQLLLEASNVGIRHRIEPLSIDLVLYLDRILAYRNDEREPCGVLRFGGPHSGAIWKDGHLVGEYDKDPEGQFIVIEIKSGFIQPDSIRRIDPVAHLVNLVSA